MSSIVQPTTLTNPNGVLIANYVSGAGANPPYGSDGIPSPTLVGGVKASAVVEFQSTNAAVLFPRMDTAHRDAIPVPVNGMIIYNNNAGKDIFEGYAGGVWGAVGGGNVVGPNVSVANTIPVYGDNTGKNIIDTLISLNPITSIISGIAKTISGVGSAANPTYTFTGDTNTGIYQSSADNIGFSTGGALALSVVGAPGNVNGFTITAANTGFSPTIFASGGDANISAVVEAKGNSSVEFWTNGAMQVSCFGPALAVNNIFLEGSITTNTPLISVNGADVNIGITYYTKGTGPHIFSTNSDPNNIQFRVQNVPNATNFLSAFGSATGAGTSTLSSFGSVDVNVGLQVVTKNAGSVDIVPGSAVSRGLTIATGTSNAVGTLGRVELTSSIPTLPANTTTLSIVGTGNGPITIVNPTAPNRTISIVVNGTTYYLSAKTTND